MENKPPRTTDERIDAIAMNLELLSHTVEENTRTTNERFDQLLTGLAELGRKTDDRMNKLLSIAEGHQRRLDALGNG